MISFLCLVVSLLTPTQFEQMRRKRAHAINIVIKQVPLIHLYVLYQEDLYSGTKVYVYIFVFRKGLKNGSFYGICHGGAGGLACN